MVKKKFIDKKNSTTYYLSFRPTPNEDDEKEGGGRPAARDAAFDEDPELAELILGSSAYDDIHYEVTDEKRREILELGLPDDGYDYLRHLREVAPQTSSALEPVRTVEVLEPEDEPPVSAGPSTSAAAAAAAAAEVATSAMQGGPSMFIPAPKFKAPGEDARLVDARALRLTGHVDGDAEAAAAAATVSAFTRTAPQHHAPGASAGGVASSAAAIGLRGRLVAELTELEESMTRLERGRQQEEREGETGKPGVQGDEEWADWLDEFVVLASTEAAPVQATAGAHGRAHGQRAEGALGAGGGGSDDSDESEDGDGDNSASEGGSEDWEDGDRLAGMPGAGLGAGGVPRSRRGAGSIASTYWRPEREDRKAGLQGIDEHFENLALQYDDDALGELDEDEQAAQARGTADISMYTSVLDEFLEENKQASHSHAQPTQQRVYRMSDYGSSEGDGSEEEEEGDGDMDEKQYMAKMQRMAQKAQRKAIGKDRNRVESLEHVDAAVIAATRARLAASAAAANGSAQQAGEGEDGGLDMHTLGESMQTVVLDRGERWDCESVLSLRSNLDNHPGRIAEPQARSGGKGGSRITLSLKTGMPVLAPAAAANGILRGQPAGGVIPEGDDEGLQGSEESEGSEEGGETVQGSGVVYERRKGETAEERRARKAGVKEARRASRAAKKELKGLFKGEATKQKKQAAGRAATGGGVGMGSSTYAMA